VCGTDETQMVLGDCVSAFVNCWVGENVLFDHLFNLSRVKGHPLGYLLILKEIFRRLAVGIALIGGGQFSKGTG